MNKKTPPQHHSFPVLPTMLVFGVILLAGLFVLLFSDAVRQEPVLEIRPKNTFDETLHVVADIDYEPFSYVNPSGEYAGMDVELMAEVANRLGMNLDLRLVEWNEANRMLRNGQADILMNMETDSIVSDNRMIGTLPFVEKQYVAYGRESISSVAQLYGKRVLSLHRLPELMLTSDLSYMDSYATMFQALAEGNADFVICPIQVGNSFVARLGLEGVRPSYAVGHVYGSFAMLTDNMALRERINPVLRDLQAEGFLTRLDEKWVHHRYAHMGVLQIIEAKPVLGALILLLTVLLGIMAVFAWSHRKRAALTAAYTEELQEHIETVERQQEELAKEKARAEEASRAKTSFLFNMSHDIRTPMNAIIGYTNLAREKKTTETEIRGYLEKIAAAEDYLLSLINDVLEMSRIESGRLELEYAEMNLPETITESAEMIRSQMEKKQISFHVDASDVKHPIVLGDRNRLRRIMMNLLSNACNFTPEGGHVDFLLTETEASEGTASFRLSVKDTGIGMSEEFSHKIFDSFERERNSTLSGVGGTGLGLAITKAFVDRMDGTIEVFTEQGRGTEFIVTLTLKTAEQPEAAAPAEKERDFSVLTGKKLLIVDDMDVNREITAMTLQEMGFETDTAVNGQDAVDRLNAPGPGAFDLILMDIQMPVMNGYEATRAIRHLEDPALAAIPIVAVTANAFSDDVRNAFESGMDGHVAKPIDLERLMETIWDVLHEKGLLKTNGSQDSERGAE